jgi:hypothetical protein
MGKEQPDEPDARDAEVQKRHAVRIDAQEVTETARALRAEAKRSIAETRQLRAEARRLTAVPAEVMPPDSA